jgi:hypothetical protein
MVNNLTDKWIIFFCFYILSIRFNSMTITLIIRITINYCVYSIQLLFLNFKSELIQVENEVEGHIFVFSYKLKCITIYIN